MTDESHLKAIYEAEFSWLWSLVRRFGVAVAEVEDVVQEVFVVVHRRLDDYDIRRPLRPWLYGIAYRVTMKHFSKTVQHDQIDGFDDVSPEATPDEKIESEQRRALVWRAIDTIPKERRAVFVLHELEGESVPRIAESLEIPLNTAYSRLRLARNDFRASANRFKLLEEGR